MGGLLTESLGRLWIFYVSGFGAACVCAAAATLLPATALPAAAARRIDLAGTLAVTLGLVALVHGPTAARRSGWTDPLVLTSLTAAAVLLLLFVLVERRHAAP